MFPSQEANTCRESIYLFQPNTIDQNKNLRGYYGPCKHSFIYICIVYVVQYTSLLFQRTDVSLDMNMYL